MLWLTLLGVGKKSEGEKGVRYEVLVRGVVVGGLNAVRVFPHTVVGAGPGLVY